MTTRSPAAALLAKHDIQPSAQRLAIAEYVLFTGEHPSAEKVFAVVRDRVPMISRATVYNTLNLFVQKGLLQELTLSEGSVAFDPRMERHHHLVDDATGTIHDIPWDAIAVTGIHDVRGVVIRDYQVILRGTLRPGTEP